MQTKTMTSQVDSDIDDPINDLTQRVEQLENSQSLSEEQIGVVLEIIKIISEFPAGKQILNRAINLHQLTKLQKIILPRRQEDLEELMDTRMPNGIKDEMSLLQLRLIQKTIRHISHRKHFEQISAQSVRSTMEKFFKKIKHNSLIHKGDIHATD
jgi:hypothetical protein